MRDYDFGNLIYELRKKRNLIQSQLGEKQGGHIMNENNNDYEQEYDSFKDVVEFQNNMYNPGHYIGTGRVPPTVSAPGNATPLAIMYIFVGALFLAFGLFLFFSDVNVTSSGLVESPMANKIIALIIMLAISLFLLFIGFVYLKKAKKYYRDKAELENEQIDETVEDKILQRTCPTCGKSHDIDYPKCPYCKFNYLK